MIQEVMLRVDDLDVPAGTQAGLNGPALPLVPRRGDSRPRSLTNLPARDRR